jgi:hypothetical protein
MEDMMVRIGGVKGSSVLLLLASTVFTSQLVAAPVDCDTMTTLTQFLALPTAGDDRGCVDQDKLYSNFTYSGGNLTTDQISVTITFAHGPGFDVHSLILSPTGLWFVGFAFGYTIEVMPPMPGVEIIGAEVQGNYGTTATNTASTVTNLSNGIVLNTSKADDTETAYPFAGVQSIASATTVTIPPGTGYLVSWEQSFTESIPMVIPEPATMALMGSGLLGLGLLLRRRKRVR